ncbi:MAG: Na+/H+ antiporter NhaC [Erysipelotrichales bacterium]
MEKPEFKKISVIYTFATLVFLFASMFFTLKIVGSDYLQIPLITTACIAGLIAWGHGYKWKNLIDAILYGIGIAMEGLIILLIIGMLIGTWVASGTVQTIIVYGLDLLNAEWFLPICLIICAITALATGSAWTTGGTVGVALMGIGLGLGINPGLVGGTIVSGAFFGDKLSPISDNSNVVSAATGVNLFDHVRHTAKTAVPGILICLVIVTVIGLTMEKGEMDNAAIQTTVQTLQDNYYIGLILLIPPVFVIVGSIFKIPAIPSLLLATAVGAAFALIFQAKTTPNLNELFSVIYNGVNIETGVESVDKIVNRGGLSSMYYNTSLAMSALALSGILEKTGMLQSLLDSMKGLLKTRVSLMLTTMVTSWLSDMATASQHMSMIIPGRMFAPAYKEQNLKLVNLTRTLADSGGLIDAIVPWSLSGVFMAGALGIPVLTYAPYTFFTFVVPVIAIFYAVTGINFPYEDGYEKPNKKEAKA